MAKEIKIKTMKRQREFIKKQLAHADTREDGSTSYSYIGYIYPEVIAYFESEGFTITKVESDMMTAMTKGDTVYLFTIGDMELTEEELKEAEAYEPAEFDDNSDEIPDFITDLLGGRGLM